MKKVIQFIENYPNHPRTFEEIGREQNLWRLKHDKEMPDHLRKERPNEDEQGAPETFTLIVTGKETLPLTDTLQWWYYGVVNFGLPPESFAAILDTWIPGTGGKVRDSANFITGERINAGLPRLPLYLTFSGVVKVLNSLEWGGGQGIPAGTRMLEIDAIDVNNLPSSLPYKGNEHLKHHLMTVRGDRVNPFVHNGGGRNGGKPCYCAILKSGGQVFVREEAAVKLESNHLPNPYIPKWDFEKEN